MQSHIEGALLEERVISDDCRRGKPTDLIVFEVLHSVEAAVRKSLSGWPKGSGAKIHVAVTVERGRLQESEKGDE